MMCLRQIRSRNHQGKYFLSIRSGKTHNIWKRNGLVDSESTDNVAKIDNLYRSAFSLTKGRPSAALLKALEQQATCDGVKVSGKHIHNFEYDELILQSKSKLSKVKTIKGSTSHKIDLLNTYLDIFLNKNQLDQFLLMVQRCSDIPISSIDQSIILRYIMKCRKDFKVHHLELPIQLRTVDKIISYFYHCNVTALKEISSKEINQDFIDEIIANYSFYPEDFKQFEAAIRLIDPSMVLCVSNEKLNADELMNKYPLTRNLVDLKPYSMFPYSQITTNAESIISQLMNEKNHFTQMQSVSNERHDCPNLWKYKSMLQKEWTEYLYKALIRESKLYKRGDHRDYRMQNCPFLDEDIVCLHTVAQHTVNYVCEQLVTQYEGIEIIVSASAIGNMVYKIYRKQHQDFEIAKYEEYLAVIRQNPQLSPQMVWEQSNTQKYHLFAPYWNPNIMHGIGGFLLNLVRLHLKFNKMECKAILDDREPEKEQDSEKVPVFTHTYHISPNTLHSYPVGTFVTHPIVRELILRNIQTRGYFYFETTEVPMLCPPKPWLYFSLSPMFLCEVPFIRYAGSDWKQYFTNILNEHDRKGHIDVMKYGLDVLGTLPWKVNSTVLKKQIDVYNAGGLQKLAIACFFDKTFPERPNPNIVDEENMNAYNKTYKALKKEHDEKFALRCTQLYTLSLANDLAGAPFWQCYNLDFRGRVYPVAPHYSQMLGDPARGTLLFAEGAPLGEDGLRWLKIHCTSKFGGLGKATSEEKEAFADSHVDQILESADKLCTEQGWWAQSTEDPWQCLAACVEIAAALRSPDPAAYVTCLPVHMDGSCNGLQHYAALGRDLEGAIKVNVASSPRPEDVYIAVMKIVLALQEAHIAAGDPTAKKVAGLVERKTLKQTVMTQVYGVTQYGARSQIRGKLQDKGMSDADAIECASYLSTLTFGAVGQLFTQAQMIQEWLNKSAYQIAESGKPVQWSTPLGLPCVQPYTKNKRHVTRTPMQAIGVSYPSPDMPVNKKKQSSAFPPNFVHSQDSTHMLMTAIQCYHAGIPFAAVHDSFWTLPCHVTEMNKILREQFVLMYSFDVLNQLKESFEAYNPELVFGDLPNAGELDINCVRDSHYFFS